MIKTIKEMQDKARHMQGDYLQAFEDMIEVFGEYLKEEEKKVNSVPNWVDPPTAYETLSSLRTFLGLDKQ